MRTYPSDSPEAIARVLAITLMADGAVDFSELKLLERQDTIRRLGLDHDRFDKVFFEYCVDLLTSANRMPSGQLELGAEDIDHLLAEVHDPALQEKVVRAMLDIVNADWSLSGGEAVLVSQAMSLWGLELHHLPPSGGRTALRQSLHIERQERPPVEGSESALHIERLTLLLNSSASDAHPAPGSFQ